MKSKNTEGIRFSIRNKLLLGFSVLFLVLLTTIILTLVQLSSTQRFSKKLITEDLPALNALHTLNTGIQSAAVDLRDWLLTAKPETKIERKQEWQVINSSRKYLDEYAKSWHDQIALSQWEKAKSIITKLETEEAQIESEAKPNQAGVAIPQILSETSPMLAELEQLLGNSTMQNTNNTGLVGLLKGNLTDDATKVNNRLEKMSIILWILLLIGIAATLVIALLIARGIVIPILFAKNLAEQIAKGEREIDIRVTTNDEISDLLLSLSHMNNSISEAETKLKYSEAKVKNILDDLQKRIIKYREFIAAVASGDLTKRLETQGDDDLAQLGKHLNNMTLGLAKITFQIMQAANEISTGLSQLESAATSQAASASEQAASVTEVTSVVEEIKATSKQTLEKAASLGSTAEKTMSESEKGRLSVSDMTASMTILQEKIQQIADTILGLSDQTQQIGEITEVVSDIAKQSKMLALNASIEAAKAGEAGRGFSVVAGEVKELAEKSQGSTQRVQKILQNIRQTAERAVIVTEEGTKSINDSLDRAEQMSLVMETLDNVIQQSAMSSRQIVAAVREESTGIDQVVTSVSEIDKVTAQFSAATEQMKAATLNLGKVADGLKTSVQAYKVSDKIDGSE